MNITELQSLLQQAQTATEEKDYPTALARYESVVTETEGETGSDEREVRLAALSERSNLLQLMGKRDEALQGYEQYYLEAGSNKHAVEALVRIGEIHSDLGRHRQALEAYDEAHALAEAFNYTEGRAEAAMGSGFTLQRLGRSEEALVSLRKALALFEQSNDERGISRTWNRLGIAHIGIGQVDRAIQAFQNALDRTALFGDRGVAIELSNLGECHQQLFNMEKALEYHREALTLAESTGLRAVEADLCRNLGFDLCNLGQVEEGIDYLQRALQITEATKDRDVRQQALYSLALAEVLRGDAEQARTYATELHEIAEGRNYRAYQADALHALGLVDQLEGNNERAEQRWQEATFLAHETGRQILLWQLHASLADIAPNAGLAHVHYQIAADIINQIAYPIEDEAMREAFLKAPPVRNVLDKLE